MAEYRDRSKGAKTALRTQLRRRIAAYQQIEAALANNTSIRVYRHSTHVRAAIKSMGIVLLRENELRYDHEPKPGVAPLVIWCWYGWEVPLYAQNVQTWPKVGIRRLMRAGRREAAVESDIRALAGAMVDLEDLPAGDDERRAQLEAQVSERDRLLDEMATYLTARHREDIRSLRDSWRTQADVVLDEEDEVPLAPDTSRWDRKMADLIEEACRRAFEHLKGRPSWNYGNGHPL